jgi:hypothetical protein
MEPAQVKDTNKQGSTSRNRAGINMNNARIWKYFRKRIVSELEAVPNTGRKRRRETNQKVMICAQ